MKIILFGKDGQLGWELQRTLPVLGDVIALGRGQVDFCDPGAIHKALKELKPTIIINASAYTNVEKAEAETEEAMRINAIAPGIVAELARKLGAVFVHYSTDYVFDGKQNRLYKEDDRANPLNVYGKSKLMGEENIQQAGDSYLILRTSWVYSLRGNSYVNKVLGWARRNSLLRIVDDQIGNPTWARMLAEILCLLLAQNKINLYETIHEKRGIYHLAGDGHTTRYEWAKQILINDPEPTGQVVKTLQPARSEDFSTAAERPLFSALDCTRFERTFGLRLPAWEVALKLALSR